MVCYRYRSVDMSETPAASEYGSGPFMHPQLTDKRIGKSAPHHVMLRPKGNHNGTVCKDFIAALEECHSEWWGARFTGACNQAKRELNLCLRKEVRRRMGVSLTAYSHAYCYGSEWIVQRVISRSHESAGPGPRRLGKSWRRIDSVPTMVHYVLGSTPSTVTRERAPRRLFNHFIINWNYYPGAPCWAITPKHPLATLVLGCILYRTCPLCFIHV